jgi:serine/threonine protein kinase
MAPEQAENYSEADARSDLYSLGSTLFHLLTGELPVKGGSYLHKLQNLLLQPPRPVLDARPDVPKELAAVVDRLRSRDPQLRPASAEEAIALLEPFARTPAQEDPRSWDGKRKVALILEVFQGRITLEEVSQRYGLPLEELGRWRARFLEAAEQEFDPSGCSASVMSQKLRDMHTKIGSQAMEIEALKERLATLTSPA